MSSFPKPQSLFYRDCTAFGFGYNPNPFGSLPRLWQYNRYSRLGNQGVCHAFGHHTACFAFNAWSVAFARTS